MLITKPKPKFIFTQVSKYQKKYNSCKTLDVDTKTKSVKVAIAELETIDRDNEVFDPKAFNKTIKDHGPNGTNEIWHLLDHDKNSFSALSKFKEVGIDGKYVYGVSQYKDSFAWREVAWPLYESGDFTQHSVGFVMLKSEKAKQGHRIITDVRLMEGSAVLWGANPNTPTMEVSKALKNLFDEAEFDREELVNARFDRLIKRITEDKYSDQNKNLLLIELMRLQTEYKATPPEQKDHGAGSGSNKWDKWFPKN